MRQTDNLTDKHRNKHGKEHKEGYQNNVANNQDVVNDSALRRCSIISLKLLKQLLNHVQLLGFLGIVRLEPSLDVGTDRSETSPITSQSVTIIK
jgi:hypothetical protein